MLPNPIAKQTLNPNTVKTDAITSSSDIMPSNSAGAKVIRQVMKISEIAVVAKLVVSKARRPNFSTRKICKNILCIMTTKYDKC